MELTVGFRCVAGGTGEQHRAAQGSTGQQGTVWAGIRYLRPGRGAHPHRFSALAPFSRPRTPSPHTHTLSMLLRPQLSAPMVAARPHPPTAHQVDKWMMDWMGDHQPDMRARRAGKCKPSNCPALGEGTATHQHGTSPSLLLLLRSKCVLRSRNRSRAIPHPGRWVCPSSKLPPFWAGISRLAILALATDRFRWALVFLVVGRRQKHTGGGEGKGWRGGCERGSEGKGKGVRHDGQSGRCLVRWVLRQESRPKRPSPRSPQSRLTP